MKNKVFIVLIILICGPMISFCQSKKKYTFTLETEDQFINDDLAITISRWALKQDGKPVEKMVPVKYWGYRKINAYFARNKNDDNYGQVMWHQEDKSTVWEYSVILEKKGSTVLCEIVAAK